jgi:hypothetical protein
MSTWILAHLISRSCLACLWMGTAGTPLAKTWRSWLIGTEPSPVPDVDARARTSPVEDQDDRTAPLSKGRRLHRRSGVVEGSVGDNLHTARSHQWISSRLDESYRFYSGLPGDPISVRIDVGIAHLKILSPLAWTTRSYLKLRCGPHESSPAARLVANEGHDYYNLEFDEYIGFCQLYSPR